MITVIKKNKEVQEKIGRKELKMVPNDKKQDNMIQKA